MNLSPLVLLLTLSPADAATVQGDIPCGTVPAGAIYTNIDTSVEVVTLVYTHGCSKGGLGATKVAGSTTSWIPGCDLLVKGTTVTKATCQVELEPNESIFLVQTDDIAGSTGAGHTWIAQGR